MTTAPPPSKPIIGPSGLMPVLTDWWQELNWPRILASPRLGLRPGRLGLALFAIIIAILLLNLGLAIDAKLVTGPIRWPLWPWSHAAEPRDQLMLPWRAYVTLPKRLIAGAPITTLVIGPIVLSIYLTMLGAISRISACELAQGQSLTWSEGLKFTIPRWRSLLGAIIGPLVIVWLIAAALVLGGWILMHVPYLNIIGGLSYPLFLIGGFLATIILIGYAFGHNLFIPAIACEGTDAIDAIQRGYTYFLAKPIRLIAYTLCGLTGLLVTVGIIAIIARWTIGFAAEGAAVWAGPDGRIMVWYATFEAIPGLFGVTHATQDTPLKTWAAGAWLIRFWTTIPILLVPASFFSCGMSVCTAIYLGMRRICDGQDWAEIWVPGMIAGTMSQALAGRAMVAQEMGTARAPIPPIEADDE